MNSDNTKEAKAVPLLERLRSVPADAVLRIDTPNALPGCADTHSIPVGPWCHEAASRLAGQGEQTARLAGEAEGATADAAVPQELKQLMAMSEDAIDAELRSLGFDPEVAAERAGKAIADAVKRAGFGTVACPMCGKREPHTHSPEEIVIFRNGAKLGSESCAPAVPSVPDASLEAFNAISKLLRERDDFWQEQIAAMRNGA